MPGHAAARSAVIADTMLPAAPVTRKTGSGPSTSPASARVRERALHQPDAPATTVGIADFHTAGIAQGLVDKHVSQRRGLPADREVDGLDQGVGPLASVRLGEPGDRAAQRAGRSGRVVAVVSAQPGGDDQERAALIQPSHGGVEVAYPVAERFLPAGEVQVVQAGPRRPAPPASTRRRPPSPRTVSMSSSGCIATTSTPSRVSRLISASATPPWSRMTATRVPAPRVTPVGTQASRSGRSAATGTRRGIRSVAAMSTGDSGSRRCSRVAARCFGAAVPVGCRGAASCRGSSR